MQFKAILIASLLVASTLCAWPTTNPDPASEAFRKCTTLASASTDSIETAIKASQADTTKCGDLWAWINAAQSTAKPAATAWDKCSASLTAGADKTAAQRCWERAGVDSNGLVAVTFAIVQSVGFADLAKCNDACFTPSTAGSWADWAFRTAGCKAFNAVHSTQKAQTDFAAAKTDADTCANAAADPLKTCFLDCNSFYASNNLVAGTGAKKSTTQWVNTSAANFKTCIGLCTADKAAIEKAVYTNPTECKVTFDWLEASANTAKPATFKTEADKCKAKITTPASATTCWDSCASNFEAGTLGADGKPTTTTTTGTTTTTTTGTTTGTTTTTTTATKTTADWVNTVAANFKACVAKCPAADKTAIESAMYNAANSADCQTTITFVQTASATKPTTFKADADKCKAKMTTPASAGTCFGSCVDNFDTGKLTADGSVSTTAGTTTTGTTTTGTAVASA